MHIQRQSLRPCLQGPVDNRAGVKTIVSSMVAVVKDGKIPYIEKGFKYVPVYASHLYNICILIAINI